MTLEDYLSDNMHSDAASTSSEHEDDSDSMSESAISSVAWGSVLACALRRAARQGRLTCGVVAAARTLERDPSTVRLCVLAPPSASGGLLHLHSVLLEAYCYENDIPTVKVDSVQKLEAIVGPSCECVLVHSVRQSGYEIKGMKTVPCYKAAEPLHKGKDGGENGLLAAARDGTHPSVLVLPVSPPP